MDDSEVEKDDTCLLMLLRHGVGVLQKNHSEMEDESKLLKAIAPHSMILHRNEILTPVHLLGRLSGVSTATSPCSLLAIPPRRFLRCRASIREVRVEAEGADRCG
jgi:hypothetical protein